MTVIELLGQPCNESDIPVKLVTSCSKVDFFAIFLNLVLLRFTDEVCKQSACSVK